MAAAIAPIPPHLLVFALSTDFTRMASAHEADCPDLGPACDGPKPPTPYNHDLVNYAYGATFDAQYGILPWLSVSTTVPYRVVTTQVRYKIGRAHV